MASIVFNCDYSLSAIKDIVQTRVSGTEDVIIVDCEGRFLKNNFDEIHGLVLHPLEFALLLCRKGKCFKNKYITLLSNQDYIDTVQLCIAQYNRATTGEYSCTFEEQVQFENHILQPENQDNALNGKMGTIELEYNKCIVDWNVISETSLFNTLRDNMQEGNLNEILSNMSIIVLGIPVASLHKCIIKMLCSNLSPTLQEIVTCHDDGLENNVTYNLVDISVNNVENMWDDAQIIRTPHAPSRTQHLLQHDLLSYLNLLVNNRNEIALTRCLSGFGCHLTHEAFTALKKESKSSGVPMYQKAVSFTTRISLGGKGYAPSMESPLRLYEKEIAEFIAVIEKLHTIVEDGTDTLQTVQRILNILKNIIIKRMDTTLKDKLNNIITKIQNLANVLIKRCAHPDYTSPARSVSAGGSICGQMTIKVLRLLVERLSSELPAHTIFEMSSQGNGSPRTSPYVLPSLVSRYKSPQEMYQSLQEMDAATCLSKNVTPERPPQFHSSRSWVVEETVIDSSSQVSAPTPVKGADVGFAQPRRVLGDYNKDTTKKIQPSKAKPIRRNLMTSGLQDKENPSGSCKRKATESKPESLKDVVKKSKSNVEKLAKPKKPIKLVAGQTKLTNFFRAA